MIPLRAPCILRVCQFRQNLASTRFLWLFHDGRRSQSAGVISGAGTRVCPDALCWHLESNNSKSRRGASRRTAMVAIRVAVIDDWQRAARQVAEWSPLENRAQV